MNLSRRGRRGRKGSFGLTFQGTQSDDADPQLCARFWGNEVVRSSPSMGLMVGRVVLELETPEKAKEDLASLSYTGDQVKPAAK
ncbi:hypothetical protein D3C72_2361960 [compost metagenome]